MTDELAREFIDRASFEDCVVEYDGVFFFCYGLSWWEEKKAFRIMVDKYRSLYPEPKFIETVLEVESPDRDECMRHFTEDPLWNGKTFWQAVTDMEWTDYEGVK